MKKTTLKSKDKTKSLKNGSYIMLKNDEDFSDYLDTDQYQINIFRLMNDEKINKIAVSENISVAEVVENTINEKIKKISVDLSEEKIVFVDLEKFDFFAIKKEELENNYFFNS